MRERERDREGGREREEGKEREGGSLTVHVCTRETLPQLEGLH